MPGRALLAFLLIAAPALGAHAQSDLRVLVRGASIAQNALEAAVPVPLGRSTALFALLASTQVEDPDAYYEHEVSRRMTRVADEVLLDVPLFTQGEPLATLRTLLLESGAVAAYRVRGDELPEQIDVYRPSFGPVRFLVAGTQPLSGSDADGDGLADAVDNCPYAANGAQTDADGDGQGNACECGDVDDNGIPATSNDRSLLRAFLADPAGAPLSAVGLGKCAVIDSRAPCSMVDVSTLGRIQSRLLPPIAQVCDAATP